MRSKIVLITGSINTQKTLYQQLKEFIPDSYSIEAYSSEVGIPKFKCDLLIISSLSMKDELDELNIKYECNDMVICERSVSLDYVDLIADIPVNEEVLLVNDEPETTDSSMKNLIDIGLNHIKYYPYYPGITIYKKLKIAITPGEPEIVPDCVTKIINMGPRMIDINSLYNIMDKLNLAHRDTTFITKKYMEKIIKVSKHISIINTNVNTLNGYLNNIVDSLVNGILVIDEDGYIKYANEEMIKIFSIDKNIINKNIKSIIDKEMFPYFLSSDVFENKMLCLFGINLITTKFKVPNSDNIVITTNRDNEGKAKNNFSQDLLLKGHYAKYNFENIIGASSLLNETKKVALKLSKSELTVLIEGESGTGKELFASAIHNNSKRKFGPFLAVNFSALPDELIESELFGYEEGAFTGAKKGGKIGLFELADGGTIFLDEIGDVSPKLQTKLLRVLQEKEVMPLGGNAIKKVDVRIIAATNKNLRTMVLEKTFRADLYYRLKIGYINLPPLRVRLSDIDMLVDYFVKNENIVDIKISRYVLDEFKKYKWLGNVRELESTIKYMLAVRTRDDLTLNDLPGRKFFEEDMLSIVEEPSAINETDYLNNEMCNILKSIKTLQNNNFIAGRAKITEKLNEIGCDITQSQTRSRLNVLEKKGYVIKKRGKQGTALTEKGINYVMKIT